MYCLRCRIELTDNRRRSDFLTGVGGEITCEDYTEHPWDEGDPCGPIHVPAINAAVLTDPAKIAALRDYDDYYRIHHDHDGIGCDICVEDPPSWIEEIYPGLGEGKAVI